MSGENNPSIEKIIAFFQKSIVFKELPNDCYPELASKSTILKFKKNTIIYRNNEPFNDFYLLESGLARVSMYSASGKKLTYLLVRSGEPLNIIAPFRSNLRELEAEAVQDTRIVRFSQKEFVTMANSYPMIYYNLINILGEGIDSVNSRFMNMIDKKVEFRLKRVLFSLYSKFGSPLRFTSTELAEIAGTTTETALRILAQFRDQGLIETSRGKIEILNPASLKQEDYENMWL
jgi:CRP-like cAMP-binding protein